MVVIRAFVAAAMLVSAAPTTFAQPLSCTFQLGFATLHDLIPDVVGGCVDNQSFDAVTGDALQHSTNGLMYGASQTTSRRLPMARGRGSMDHSASRNA